MVNDSNGASPAATFDSTRFLSDTTQQPGIYQMFGEDGAILYVGKAKNLKSRLASYFRKTGLTIKTAALVAKIPYNQTRKALRGHPEGFLEVSHRCPSRGSRAAK
jgi:hypothetical protein